MLFSLLCKTGCLGFGSGRPIALDALSVHSLHPVAIRELPTFQRAWFGLVRDFRLWLGTGSASDGDEYARKRNSPSVAMPERTREYRNHHLDSTRWDAVAPRDGDIIITSAYRTGTTWTQRIVAGLVLGPGPAKLSEISPWVDARFQGPIDELVARLNAQRHRRFLKSHLAADGVPFLPQVKCVVVGRDTRDVFMSLWNHYSSYTDYAYDLLNGDDRPRPALPRCPSTARVLWGRWMTQGWFDWETDRWPFWSLHHHLTTWWAARELPNVLFVHYADLLVDTEAEMRRIAAFLEIDVAEQRWPALLAEVGLDSMRAEAVATEDVSPLIFRGGRRRSSFAARTVAGTTCSPTTTSRSMNRRHRNWIRVCDAGWKAAATH